MRQSNLLSVDIIADFPKDVLLEIGNDDFLSIGLRLGPLRRSLSAANIPNSLLRWARTWNLSSSSCVSFLFEAFLRVVKSRGHAGLVYAHAFFAALHIAVPASRQHAALLSVEDLEWKT
jgi:hypothetical protein